MSKLSYQAKVYNMLKEVNGPVSVEQLLSIEGLLPYKLSAYILYAKIDFGAVIKPIRNGRKVTAYELVDAGNGIAARKTTAVKAPKAAKVKSAPKVEVVAADPVEKTLKSDKLADIVGQMENDVSLFEDRMFAEDFVRSL